MLRYVLLGSTMSLAALLMLVGITTTQQSSKGLETLSLEDPPTQLPINGAVVNLTGDELDRDININPTKPLPFNGTEMINIPPTATDLDINLFPPPNVKVIIENKTITVTNHPVTIGESAPPPSPPPAIPTPPSVSSGDSGGGDDDEE